MGLGDTVASAGSCKQFAPRCRQITTPTPNFYRPDALLDAQPTLSKLWRQKRKIVIIKYLHSAVRSPDTGAFMTVRRVFGSRSSVAELVSAGSELQMDGAATLKALRASLGRGTATDGHGLGLMFFGNCRGLGWVQWHCDRLGQTTAWVEDYACKTLHLSTFLGFLS